MFGTTRRAKLYFRSCFDRRRRSARRQPPDSAILLTDRFRWTPQGAHWNQGQEHGPEESPGKAGTRLPGPGLQDRSHGCCQPDPGIAPHQHRRHLQPDPPPNLRGAAVVPTRSGEGTGPPAPQRRRPPPSGLVPLPPRLTGRGGRRSSPRVAGTGDCWPSLRGSARSSSSSLSHRRRQARVPRVRAALLLTRRPPADSSPRTAPTPASPWRTPRPPRPAAASAPLPARPRRPGSGPGVTGRRAAPRESESRPPTMPRTPRAPPARNYTSRRAPRCDSPSSCTGSIRGG